MKSDDDEVLVSVSEIPFIWPLSLLNGGTNLFIAGLLVQPDGQYQQQNISGGYAAMPVSLPFSSGITLPTALAAPVDAGMMFWAAPRPPATPVLAAGTVNGLLCGSGVTVIILKPSLIPYLSLITWPREPMTMVVQEALNTT